MSTDQIPQNILCLKTLALNILKNGFPDIIAKGIEVPELGPCSRCKEELFLYELKKPFMALICGHIFHCRCLEDYVKNLSQCPIYEIEIEPLLINTAEPRPKKKPRKEGEKKESSIIKKIIKELSTNTFGISKVSEEVNVSSSDFLQLSNKIDHAESKNEDTTRELIESYFNFGKAIYKRYKELKAIHDKVGATVIVRNEVRKEILKIKFTDDALRKRKDRAEK
ncbi:15397_t:CDS:2, partial [Gigaspora margarita]